jgi:hypothetical protein
MILLQGLLPPDADTLNFFICTLLRDSAAYGSMNLLFEPNCIEGSEEIWAVADRIRHWQAALLKLLTRKLWSCTITVPKHLTYRPVPVARADRDSDSLDNLKVFGLCITWSHFRPTRQSESDGDLESDLDRYKRCWMVKYFSTLSSLPNLNPILVHLQNVWHQCHPTSWFF